MRAAGVFRISSSRRLGLATFGVLVAIGASIVFVSTSTWGQRDYTAMLEHAAGLRVGESVEVAGVDAGRVTDIAVVDGEVQVSFVLDAGIRLGRDTTASVDVATLLGTHLLAVEPRGPGELPGARIPIERTQVPYNLQDVIDQGTRTLDSLDVDLLDRALASVAGVLRQAGPEVRPALEGINRLATAIDRQRADLGVLLAAARDVTTELAASRGQVRSLVRKSSLVLGELVSRRDVIAALLRDTTRLSRALSGIVTDNEKNIGPVLDDLDTVVRILRENKQVLADAVEKIGIGSKYTANASGIGPWLELYFGDGVLDLQYCKQNPRECQ